MPLLGRKANNGLFADESDVDDFEEDFDFVFKFELLLLSLLSNIVFANIFV